MAFSRTTIGSAGAVVPALAGFLAPRPGRGYAIVMFSGRGLAVMIAAPRMPPETRGRALASLEAAE